MMELKLRIILLVFSLLSLIILTNLVKRYRLELKYALLWISISILFVVLAIFPSIADFTADIMGIKASVNAIYFLGIISLLMISFSLTISLSRTSNRVKNLTQELGLIRQKMDDIEKNISIDKPSKD
ncbi:MAG: hypothetical protein APF84_10565 [Gracilibacter sp. BRH_c7a]|nr:MAG: hypothetical protein APF84_10565 [Gracilibacter sp. BRH_c7a]